MQWRANGEQEADYIRALVAVLAVMASMTGWRRADATVRGGGAARIPGRDSSRAREEDLGGAERATGDGGRGTGEVQVQVRRADEAGEEASSEGDGHSHGDAGRGMQFALAALGRGRWAGVCEK